MSEDGRYRQSTQYRLWSYTPSSLASLRAQTNAQAAQKVQAAVARARANASSADTSETDSKPALPDGEVQCLTPEEELKLLWYYCGRTLAMGDHLNLPTEVKSTAVQYLKRFYITNSIMTYAPAEILKTALFFATKTENYYVKLSKFAEAIGNTTSEDVLASEFLLTQGLRFTFDIRHPFRALEGVCMEIHAMACGDELTFPHGGEAVHEKPEQLEKRNKHAHHIARNILKTNAQLTDVYFHFTPSQIMLAALAIADSHLVTWYLGTKFPAGSDEHVVPLYHKIMETVQRCVDMLQSVQPQEGMELLPAERKEIKALSKKLSKCRNPEKLDLVALQRAKREGELGEEERQAKKRKLEREMSAKEGEDLFGPAIQR